MAGFGKNGTAFRLIGTLLKGMENIVTRGPRSHLHSPHFETRALDDKFLGVTVIVLNLQTVMNFSSLKRAVSAAEPQTAEMYFLADTQISPSQCNIVL